MNATVRFITCTVATARRECEYAAWKLIRINPHDTEPLARGILLPVGALKH